MGSEVKKLIEVIGYVTKIEPRTKRGLMEYRVRIMTLGGEDYVVYIREPPTWIEYGIPVHLKAEMSRQTEERRYIVEEIEIARSLPWFSLEETEIEEILGEKIQVVSGKRRGRYFSLPLETHNLSQDIIKETPGKFYCLFLESIRGTILATIIGEREYKILEKTKKFIRLIEDKL